MARIDHGLRKAQSFITRPLMKIVAGKRVPLSAEEAKRVPPGQFSTDRFSVLHHETRLPSADEIKRWTLTIDGAVERPVTLTLDELKRLPGVEQTADFHCVTTWSRLGNRWRGVRVRDVLALARPESEGRFVTQTASSGHTTSTPIADVLVDDALVAWEHDGEPLSPEHGAPLRVVLPKKYAYKGVKWLNRLTVTKDEELGFWEVRGYSQSADPWNEERYS